MCRKNNIYYSHRQSSLEHRNLLLLPQFFIGCFRTSRYYYFFRITFEIFVLCLDIIISLATNHPEIITFLGVYNSPVYLILLICIKTSPNCYFSGVLRSSCKAVGNCYFLRKILYLFWNTQKLSPVPEYYRNSLHVLEQRKFVNFSGLLPGDSYFFFPDITTRTFLEQSSFHQNTMNISLGSEYFLRSIRRNFYGTIKN